MTVCLGVVHSVLCVFFVNVYLSVSVLLSLLVLRVGCGILLY